MPRGWVRILLIVLVVAVALYLVGYLIFKAGDSTPGSGTGEILTGLTTP